MAGQILEGTFAMSPLQQPLRASLCVASGFFAFQLLHLFFIGTGAAAHGAAARHCRLDNTPSPQPDAPPRYNQKSTTLRNGATEEGWFYPTPAALKAAADVRGARAARESCRLRRLD